MGSIGLYKIIRCFYCRLEWYGARDLFTIISACGACLLIYGSFNLGWRWSRRWVEIIFLNKLSKHLNIILSISHLKSAECTKVRRVYAFASLKAQYITQLLCRNAASFRFAITSVCGSENYWWEIWMSI